MLLPCPIVPPAAVQPLHRLPITASKAVSHVLHRHIHRLHRAVHAAAAHAHALMSGACHLGPGVLAVVALGVLAPPAPAHQPLDSISPSASSTRAPPPNDQGAGPADWIVPASSGPAQTAGHTQSALADTGSTVFTLLPTELPTPPSATRILAPFMDPTAHRGMALALPAGPSLLNAAQTTSLQPVPEPSSVLTLACGLCGLGLIRRGRLKRPMPIAR